MKFEISFKADLTSEKKELLDRHFAGTLRLMGSESEALTITLREKPDPVPAVAIKESSRHLHELLSVPLKHTDDVLKCFEACKSKTQVVKVIRRAPTYLGTFDAEFDDECRIFTIYNTYFDGEEDCEEEYWYDYPEDWEDENED
jgi:hypothetical protein